MLDGRVDVSEAHCFIDGHLAYDVGPVSLAINGRAQNRTRAPFRARWQRLAGDRWRAASRRQRRDHRVDRALLGTA